MSFKLFSVSVLALALSAPALPAAAQDVSVTGTQQTSVRVSYGDLNLSTQAGANAMLARIARAAAAACSPGPIPGDLKNAADYQACVNAATQQAIAQLGSPLVAEAQGTGLAGASVANN